MFDSGGELLCQNCKCSDFIQISKFFKIQNGLYEQNNYFKCIECGQIVLMDSTVTNYIFGIKLDDDYRYEDEKGN